MGKDLREVEHHHDHHSKGDGDYTMATADMTESMGHHHHQPTDAGLFNKIWISSMIQPDPATWYSEEEKMNVLQLTVSITQIHLSHYLSNI